MTNKGEIRTTRDEYRCKYCVNVFFLGNACEHPKTEKEYKCTLECDKVRKLGTCPLGKNLEIKVLYSRAEGGDMFTKG
jgi:hypothetical protein